MKKLIPQNLKNIYHLLKAVGAAFYFGFPGKKIKIIGITGTNGKTTTTQMITKILEEAGFKVAMASTINFKLDKEEWVNETKFTTLSAWKVQEFIQRAVNKKCDYLVLETSSHSLDQFRVWGIDYDTAVITNVTREHLDYHKTMEIYRDSKLKLFRKARKLVVNLDMEKPEDFYNFQNKELIYGYTTADKSIKQKDLEIVKAQEIKMFAQYSQFKISEVDFRLNLPGKFNIENSLAAISVGLVENMELKTIATALGKVTLVPGRMEYIDNNKNINIIVDYAVTPDSLEKLYDLIKTVNVKNNKVIAVFGSCGERDRGKRPIMGEIVARSTDIVIVTNEDPYNEDPERIINEVFGGVVGKEVGTEFTKHSISDIQYPINAENQKLKIEGKNCWRIMDRRQAINFALSIAKEGDFVVVTGKGAEEIMLVREKRIPWNDKKVILEELKML